MLYSIKCPGDDERTSEEQLLTEITRKIIAIIAPSNLEISALIICGLEDSSNKTSVGSPFPPTVSTALSFQNNAHSSNN